MVETAFLAVSHTFLAVSHAFLAVSHTFLARVVDHCDPIAERAPEPIFIDLLSDFYRTFIGLLSGFLKSGAKVLLFSDIRNTLSPYLCYLSHDL